MLVAPSLAERGAVIPLLSLSNCKMNLNSEVYSHYFQHRPVEIYFYNGRSCCKQPLVQCIKENRYLCVVCLRKGKDCLLSSVYDPVFQQHVSRMADIKFFPPLTSPLFAGVPRIKHSLLSLFFRLLI